MKRSATIMFLLLAASSHCSESKWEVAFDFDKEVKEGAAAYAHMMKQMCKQYVIDYQTNGCCQIFTWISEQCTNLGADFLSPHFQEATAFATNVFDEPECQKAFNSYKESVQQMDISEIGTQLVEPKPSTPAYNALFSVFHSQHRAHQRKKTNINPPEPLKPGKLPEESLEEYRKRAIQSEIANFFKETATLEPNEKNKKDVIVSLLSGMFCRITARQVLNDINEELLEGLSSQN